MWYKAVLS
uniref:Uncharacterized protein n=1 Tax=Anguilla anguilla TaxID=7936 RepID=A0A0E9VQ75_ANGAN